MENKTRPLSETSPHLSWIAFRDLIIIVGILVLVKQTLLPITQLYAGPVSTLTAMITATLLLWRRGMSWKALGFSWPKSWFKTIGLTLLTIFVFIIATQTMGVFADHFFEDVNYGTRFDHIEGNLNAYILIMLIVWTHGSFFEELLFRAFMISHISEFMGGKLSSDVIALILSSTFFGYRHAYYQGIHGALITGAGGFAFGALYFWFGRKNIIPLILAHGIFNTLGQTFRFLGIEE